MLRLLIENNEILEEITKNQENSKKEIKEMRNIISIHKQQIMVLKNLNEEQNRAINRMEICISDIKYKNIAIFSENKRYCDNFSYINWNLEEGIYHIKYELIKYERCDGVICFGLSNYGSYTGKAPIREFNFFRYNTSTSGSSITKECSIGKIVNNIPFFDDFGKGSIFDLTIDMNKREFYISHNNSAPVLLIKELISPVYTFVSVTGDSRISIVLVYHEE